MSEPKHWNDNIDPHLVAHSANIRHVCFTIFWCTLIVCGTAIWIAYLIR